MFVSAPFTAKRLALALLASASPLAIHPALAQSGPAPAAAPDTTGEIVVTATKRSENLQNVPISITAMTNQQLSQHQVSAFDDYAKMLPSVSFQSFGPSQSQINMRGITSGGDGVSVGPLPTVGLYLDETPLTTIANAVDLHVYDLERVEALSGPQGTLYGASSLAGTLRLISVKPKLGKWEGGVDAELNKFGPGSSGGKVEGFINVPLGDHVALRANGFWEHDGGYISNTAATRTYQRTHFDALGNAVNSPLTVNNAPYVKRNFNTVDSAGGRAALKVDLDDNWTITPTAIYQHQIARGTFLFNDPTNPNYSAPYVPGQGALQVHDFTPDRNRDEWYLASATLQGKVSDWDLTYSGSYFERWTDNTADYSYFSVAYDNLSQLAALPANNPSYTASYAGYSYLKDSLGHDIDPTQTVHAHDKYSKMSHELRISSPATDRARLTAGLFFQRQTDNHIADYINPGLHTAVDQPGSPVFSSPLPGAPQDDVYYTNIYRIDRDYAAFAEGAFDILPTLTLTAGIRGFKARNTLGGFSGGLGALNRVAGVNACAVVTVTACPNVKASYSESGETHKVGLKWQATPAKMVYLTYSTGFRPGGNNRNAFNNGHEQNIPPFHSDTITNYELGFKTAWLDRKLYIDGAVFDEEWHNVQYSLPGILGIFYTVNAGKARSRGAELQVSVRPAPGLSLMGNATYIDAKLTSDFVTNAGVVLAPAGTRLPITAKFKANTTARYDMHLGLMKAFVQAGMNYQTGTTSYLTTGGEAVLGPTDGFSTFDFSAGVAKDQWTLSAYITNAFDERGILSKNSACAPSICGQYARLYPAKPQEFGIKTGYRF